VAIVVVISPFSSSCFSTATFQIKSPLHHKKSRTYTLYNP
jgi:hypothetical protein